ncbi:MAG: DUF4256 domain-containing protein [Edaphocola sp.]
MKNKKAATPEIATVDIMEMLKTRFEENTHRHRDIAWQDVQARIAARPRSLATLAKMEESGGEPDVIGYDEKNGQYIFCDCSAESPSGRRSLCYDQEAWLKRKEHRPAGSAMEMAAEMGIALLTEEEYRTLQGLQKVEAKTSSWLATPEPIRKLGGAIFGDFRYDTVFVYHNGAESYYAGRGFRGSLKV